jgi:TatD DNase family protein
MFVDIHTHSFKSSSGFSIRNLSFSEAEILIKSDHKGLFSLGFHPWFANDFTLELMNKIENWVTDKRIVAIGECGLDKNSKVDFEKQLFVFEKQIALSEKIEKPLIIHCVGCFNELFELKKKWNPQQLWLIHGFRGKLELASQALKNGCSISYGEHFNAESVRITPIENLFVETDESKLGIDEIYKNIAAIKGCKVEELTAGFTFLSPHLSIL